MLQLTLGWTNSHLHQFIVGRVTYGMTALDPMDVMDDVEDEKKVRLSEIADAKSKFIYEYDFGDGWEHDVVVERVVDSRDLVLECTDGKRACPPEDSGGPHGYENLLAVIANPKDPEHRQMRQWVGRHFDPETSEKDDINKILRRETTALRRRRAQKSKPKPKRANAKSAND